MDAVTVRALRQDLLRAGFTVDGVAELLGEQASAALHRDQLIPVRWHLDRQPGSPLATLVRFFLLGEPAESTALERALPSTGTHALAESGLLAGRDDSLLRAGVEIRPYAEEGGPHWWVVSDHGEPIVSGPLPADHVLGIGQASLTLADATIRRPARRALDLGIGCGVQSLHLSRHARHVVGSDVSERALHLARLGLALSEVSVDLRSGDLFDALAGGALSSTGADVNYAGAGTREPGTREPGTREPGDAALFDLIVSNPPFVITPRSAGLPTYTYRDGGRSGDDIVATVVRQGARHLTPGGILQALGNWEIHGSDWRRRPTQWLDQAVDPDGVPVDAWIVQREVLDPAEYAAMWARDAAADRAQTETYIRAWLDDFARRGVDAIGLGLITLRRPGPGTRPLRRLEEAAARGTGPLGPHLDACLGAHDTLPAADRDVLGLRLSVRPEVSEERTYVPGAEDPTRITLVQSDGYARRLHLDTAMAALVGACDGSLTVGQIVAAIADLLETDIDPLAARAVRTIRRLVLEGFVWATVTSGPAG
ncbi:MAG: transferase [Actinomycetales bacterium]